MRIWINGVGWDLLLVDPYSECLYLYGRFTLGVTDVSQRTICIANNLDDITFYKVLIHEIAHAFLFSHRINTSGSCEELMCKVIEEYADDIQGLTNEIYDLT